MVRILNMNDDTPTVRMDRPVHVDIQEQSEEIKMLFQEFIEEHGLGVKESVQHDTMIPLSAALKMLGYKSRSSVKMLPKLGIRVFKLGGGRWRGSGVQCVHSDITEFLRKKVKKAFSTANQK